MVYKKAAHHTLKTIQTLQLPKNYHIIEPSTTSTPNHPDQSTMYAQLLLSIALSTLALSSPLETRSSHSGKFWNTATCTDAPGASSEWLGRGECSSWENSSPNPSISWGTGMHLFQEVSLFSSSDCNDKHYLGTIKRTDFPAGQGCSTFDLAPHIQAICPGDETKGGACHVAGVKAMNLPY